MYRSIYGLHFENQHISLILYFSSVKRDFLKLYELPLIQKWAISLSWLTLLNASLLVWSLAQAAGLRYIYLFTELT